jgi:hypothetical protein
MIHMSPYESFAFVVPSENHKSAELMVKSWRTQQALHTRPLRLADND